MSSRTIIHFKDGSTITDKEMYPHEVSEEQLENITSVERVIAGWHLSILKSESIKSFFIITEAFQSLMFGRPGKYGPPPKISMRALGCYLEGSDPAVKLLLGMDPRTKNIVLEGTWVKKFRPDGFARPLEKRVKRDLRKTVTKEMGDKIVTLTLKEAKEFSYYLEDVHGIKTASCGAVMMAWPAADGADG